MLAVTKSQHPPHLHHSDSSSSENSPHPLPTTPSTTVAQNVKHIQSSISTTNMLVVTAPPIPSAPILHTNTGATGKRPKLSLQTSGLPVAFGNSTTALSLSHSVSCSQSPTVRNTFRNAYDAYRRTSSPASSIRNESCTREPKPSKPEALPLVPPRQNQEEVPYQLPLGIRGILRNSPHVTSTLRRSSLSAATASSGNGRRILFPAKKRVAYRYPIDEEITTVKFVARHSDLTSSDSSACSSIQNSSDSDASGSSGSDDDRPDSKNKEPTRSSSPGKRKKYNHSSRQVRAAGLRDRLPGTDKTPETPDTPGTPVRCRKKRQRQWRWTLGPIHDNHVESVSPSSASPVTASSAAT